MHNKHSQRQIGSLSPHVDVETEAYTQWSLDIMRLHGNSFHKAQGLRKLFRLVVWIPLRKTVSQTQSTRGSGRCHTFSFYNFFFVLILTQGYIFDWFSERETETEKEREKHQSLASRMHPTRDQNTEPRCVTMDRTLNLLVHRTMLQPSEPPG